MAEDRSRTMGQNFVATPISMKLEENNYLQWKDQAKSTIEENDMLNHPTEEEISQILLPNGAVNPEFQKWKRQDALLKSWLLASMSNPFTTRAVGCTLTHQIWKRLEDHFSSQIKAKVMQLKNKLSTIQIGNSVTEYVLSIKSTMDALASVGESMKESDHVNAILHGLTEEYGNVMTSVLARSTSIKVGELEALLLVHESMLARFRKSESFVQANVAQHSQHSQIQQNHFYSQSSAASGNYRGNFRDRFGKTFRRNSRSTHDAERMTQDRGRMMQGGRAQCQVYDRIGHTAKFCWYRYDKEQYEDVNGSSNQVKQPKANYSNVLATPSII
ncbi:uncharacterized protein [Arachis hypogaea]|uniref:uncharacterized protein n=1 Tax=Arachis hypogaea TaxID=3818 RepID=UPI003B20CC44